MTEEKKEKLRAAGFRISTVEDFLKLSSEEQQKLNNAIIRNGKLIGFCECQGKGKQNCRGNGWIRDGEGYQKCPFFIPNE
jgi:hypothetical protein